MGGLRQSLKSLLSPEFLQMGYRKMQRLQLLALEEDLASRSEYRLDSRNEKPARSLNWPRSIATCSKPSRGRPQSSAVERLSLRSPSTPLRHLPRQL